MQRHALNVAALGLERRSSRMARAAFWRDCAGAPNKAYAQARQELEQLRALLAEMLGGDEGGWFFAPGTTLAMEQLGRALLQRRPGPWRVVTTPHEHRGGIGFFLGHPRFHVFRSSDLSSAADPAARLAETARSQRADLVVYSQVTYDLGLSLPTAEILRELRGGSEELLVVCDGAQAAGHVPVLVAGYDAYLFSGHKWLGGPLGSGALYLGPRLRAHPLYLNGSPLAQAAPAASAEPRGTYDYGIIAGLVAALRDWQDEGPRRRSDRLREKARGLSTELTQHAALSSWLSGCLSRPRSGIVSFKTAALPADQLVQRLAAAEIHTKAVSLPGGERVLRLAPDPLSSTSEVSALCAALAECAPTPV